MIDINNDISLWIKHTFLKFLQGYFSLEEEYTWDYDVRNTKIIIADRFSVDLGVIEKKPAILLSRGNFGWMNYFRGQKGINTKSIPGLAWSTLAPAPTANMSDKQVFTDLVRGNITFNIISKNGLEADKIASKIFTLITAYNPTLMSMGMHSISNLNVGEEQLLKSSSVVEAQGVAVSLMFMSQRTVYLAAQTFNCEVFLNSEKIAENIDFLVTDNGLGIEFVTAPEIGDTITINYIDALTLEARNDQLLIGDINGENIEFAIDNGAIYGYYVLSNEFLMDLDEQS